MIKCWSTFMIHLCNMHVTVKALKDVINKTNKTLKNKWFTRVKNPKFRLRYIYWWIMYNIFKFTLIWMCEISTGKGMPKPKSKEKKVFAKTLTVFLNITLKTMFGVHRWLLCNVQVIYAECISQLYGTTHLYTKSCFWNIPNLSKDLFPKCSKTGCTEQLMIHRFDGDLSINGLYSPTCLCMTLERINYENGVIVHWVQ